MEREIYVALGHVAEFESLSAEEKECVSPCRSCDAEYLAEGGYEANWYCPMCE